MAIIKLTWFQRWQALITGIVLIEESVEEQRDVLEPEDIWILDRGYQGPWSDKEEVTVRVLEVKDGWVRYFQNDCFPDERMKLSVFRHVYKKKGA